LPRDGIYDQYPFSNVLLYNCAAVFELNEADNHLSAFDKDKLVFITPIKRERENTGRCKLKGGKRYVVVTSTEVTG